MSFIGARFGRIAGIVIATLGICRCADTRPDMAASYQQMNCPDAERDLMARQDSIQATLDESFVDDPIGWLVDRIALDSETEAYNFRLESFNRRCLRR
jgi:hypothetical protein